MSKPSRIRIIIRGAVQGVGFRPFVYRLASALELCGWVSNSTQGVLIEAEGPGDRLEEFLVRIERDRPVRASIHSLEHSFLDPIGFAGFEIRHSDTHGAKTALVLPDIATCRDCLAEIFDPADRRYLYPFTNCTNCGPRFTIVESLPYDRPNTTMRGFTMCPSCRSEYEDPLNRRFHAQPNACAECGPHLELWDPGGGSVAAGHEALGFAVEELKSGRIVAVKGLGGFHLMVDASNDEAVVRLRQRKHREEKPFAVMVPSLESVHQLCALNPMEARLLSAPESPIVILPRRHDDLARSIAPRNPFLGVMLPYTPLHHILMKQMKVPLVATSGNLSDEPICIDECEALQRLAGIADMFLVHNRPIRRHVDDSIVRVMLGREQILRRARGYAPLPIVTRHSLPATLAVGAHLKNAIALATESGVFLSQHIGDLDNHEALTAFRNVIDDFERMFEVRPDHIACDLHPDYASTHYAEPAPIRIQHHCAHVASCMADNDLEPPALGVAWDGSGYGTDQTIWGGEFLLAENGGFRRVGHFRTFPLPGGDAAAKKPRHTALGVLYEILGETAFDGSEPPLLRQALIKQVRTTRTSSVGRLFDAVASIIGIRHDISFQGQAAMELEFAAAKSVGESYSYRVQTREALVVDWEPMIREVLCDLQKGIAIGVIAAKFHNTLAEIVVDIAQRVGEPKVVLTGGCFQNRYLTERSIHLLEDAGFLPYWHQRVPPHDGGIALGQAAISGKFGDRRTRGTKSDQCSIPDAQFLPELRIEHRELSIGQIFASVPRIRRSNHVSGNPRPGN